MAVSYFLFGIYPRTYESYFIHPFWSDSENTFARTNPHEMAESPAAGYEEQCKEILNKFKRKREEIDTGSLNQSLKSITQTLLNYQ